MNFVIKFQADKTFDYDQGLQKEIYKAVSSYGIDIESGTWISNLSMIEFSILVIEFLAVWVLFLTLKLSISVNTTVRWIQDYQTAKLSSYF